MGSRAAAAVVPASSEAWTCVAFGSTHQGDMRFTFGINSQCVAMSACASIYSCRIGRRVFTSFDIDTILESGDRLYGLVPRPPGVSYLLPEELPSDICVGSYSARIKPMNENWVANGLFPDSAFNVNDRLIFLKNLLNDMVFVESHSDIVDSYIFTGQSYAVSFWRYESYFYLFNSHAVGISNCYDNNSTNNVARLFRCASATTLAKLLFARGVNDGCEYSIHRVSLVSEVANSDIESDVEYMDVVLDERNVSLVPIQSPPSSPLCVNMSSHRPTPSNSVINLMKRQLLTNPVVVLRRLRGNFLYNFVTNDFKFIFLRPVVLLMRLKVNPSVELYYQTNDYKLKYLRPVVVVDVKIVRDRPKMIKKPGRPRKGKGNFKSNVEKARAHTKAVLIYSKNNLDKRRAINKRFDTTHPEVNRAAVQRYAEQHPEVNRAAVQRYAEQHPEVNRAAVNRYIEQHPEVNRAAVQRYAEQHPEVNRAAVERYNTLNRSVDPNLRSSSLLIGQRSNADLDSVTVYSFRKSSLLLDDIHRCPHCRARLFEEEKSRAQWCCGQGSYNVLNLPPLEEDFYRHPSFVSRPRAYNNLFAFSALGVSHGFQVPNAGFSFLKIQGRVYHRVFDLAYTGTVNPIGLYIHDSHERERLAEGQNLDLVVIRSINNFLHNVNPFIDCFKRLSREASDEAHLVFEPTTRRTHGNILGDMPIGREVAAIISTDRESYVPRSIAIWRVGARAPHFVDIFNVCYESFQYPLLYPHGTPGWYLNRNDNKGKKLSQVKYVRCLLLSESRFTDVTRLSEEWVVDMYCRIEEERLRFLRNIQKGSSSIRVAPFSEILRASEVATAPVPAQSSTDAATAAMVVNPPPRHIADDETIRGEGALVPGRIYLPNSFTGGPRYMKTKYMDAMALVNRLGNPSFFLTMTCNPSWPEIRQSLSNPENKSHPVICNRVFQLKLQQLLRDIRSGRWFGKCTYLLYVIEFQKRGLPHAHICFRVEGGGTRA